MSQRSATSTVGWSLTRTVEIQTPDERRGEYLHVAGKYHQIRIAA
jgi:hypothetical protein